MHETKIQGSEFFHFWLHIGAEPVWSLGHFRSQIFRSAVQPVCVKSVVSSPLSLFNSDTVMSICQSWTSQLRLRGFSLRRYWARVMRNCVRLRLNLTTNLIRFKVTMETYLRLCREFLKGLPEQESLTLSVDSSIPWAQILHENRKLSSNK